MNDRVVASKLARTRFASEIFAALGRIRQRATTFARVAPSRSFSIAECRPVAVPFARADIVRGDPRARSLNQIASADGKLDCGVWECTPGTFRIQYRSDELVHILEGRVIVHVADTTHALGPGDVAYFPAGTRAEWDVVTPVRKLWVYRTPSRGLLERGAAKLLRVLSRRS